ncbi:coadhesin-like [Watersipora subatra]|uniref:coadhesin-like n=1 Tax=Watersipora subatra TaxID=2589382 RepID=UPI00355C13B6
MVQLIITLVVASFIGLAANGVHAGYAHQHPAAYGHWSYWAEWSSCSKTCGGGYQSRTRECERPYHVYGEYRGCLGEESETRVCNSNHCPVDGGWSAWSAYSACSVSCGGGEKSRERTCTYPSPAYGGAYCYGDSTETVSCNEQYCPVDGGWSAWSAYSACSVSCGGGEKSRERTCTYPSPAHGGAYCEGDSSETTSCNEQYCPVDGNWSEWGPYGYCSVECGQGTKTRHRSCDSPAPAYGGDDCYGSDKDSTYCHASACPVDGSWSSWDSWSSCSGECGEGYRVRSRSCTYPAPANGGADCEGASFETEKCQHYNACYHHSHGYSYDNQQHGYPSQW